MLLEQVKGIVPDAELNTEYEALSEHINLLLNQMNVILEAPFDGRAAADSRIDNASIPPGAMGSGEDIHTSDGGNKMPRPGQVDTGGSIEEVLSAMEQVTKQMDAAKRGLGLVNKLPPGESRGTNASRIMGNMNRIRANVRRIEKMLGSLFADPARTMP